MQQRSFVARLAVLACTLIVCTLTVAQAQPESPRIFLPALGRPLPYPGPGGAVELQPVAAVESVTYPYANRFVIVLDVSGSQNLNFAGQGVDSQTQEVVQCVTGPNGEPWSRVCDTPEFAWPNVTERRIYAQKQGVLYFIGLTNMPGNPAYDPNAPKDEVIIVAYNQGSPESWLFGPSSDRAAIHQAVQQAGAVADDPYKTSGDSNGAAGLLRAREALAAAPTQVDFNGQTLDYRNFVILFADGVANSFLDEASPDLFGGLSDAATYPAGSYCRSLGVYVKESGECQATSVGGLYNGMDRPLTEMVSQAEQLRNEISLDTEIAVIALSTFEVYGLETGVATPGLYFSVPNLTVDASGRTSVDRALLELIVEVPSISICTQITSPWVDRMAPNNYPLNVPLPPPAVGEVYLQSASFGVEYVQPILRDPQTGRLSFRFPELPAGAYTLQAYAYYRGDDGETRLYSGLYQNGDVVGEITLLVTEDQQELAPLQLVYTGNVCLAE